MGSFPGQYASRELSKCGQGYTTVEKECLALVWGVQRFKKYLYGKKFVVETDHQPLGFLQEAQLNNSSLLGFMIFPVPKLLFKVPLISWQVTN